MKKFVCTVCGYVFEGEAAPAECPVCHAGADKFKEQTGEREWAAEHVIGVAQGVSEKQSGTGSDRSVKILTGKAVDFFDTLHIQIQIQ